MKPSTINDLDSSYDVIIIGAGINGTAIARECGLRRLKTLLVDQQDICSATSSASSKLAHGGLRYLENREFSLVSESCRERERLLKQAPHLVSRLPFIMPIYDHDRHHPLMVRCGLTLYDWLSATTASPRHKKLSLNQLESIYPLFNNDQLRSSFCYFDSQMDDSRLGIECAQQAHQLGVDICLYSPVTSLTSDEQGIKSVSLSYHGVTKDIQANWVINTTGPWTDSIQQWARPSKPPTVTTSKGVHIVTRKITTDHAILCHSPKDQRVCFIIPWHDHTLIGTTDTFYDGPLDTISITSEDIDYLLDLAAYIFPKTPLKTSDIVSSFVGLRPLMHTKESSMSSASRDHKVIVDQNLISLVGGKYTTFRKMAEDVMKTLFDLKSVPFESLTEKLPYMGGFISDLDHYIDTHYDTDRQLFPVSEDLYRHVIHHYGSTYQDILTIFMEHEQWQTPLNGTNYYEGDVVVAIRREFATQIDDFMRRRTPIKLLTSNGLKCLERVAHIFQQELGWTEDYTNTAKSNYKDSIQLVR